MSIYSGFKSSVSAALAVTLTSLLAWAFASSTSSIQWLGSDAVTTTIAAIQTDSADVQNA
jgi:hypothetical protein